MNKSFGVYYEPVIMSLSSLCCRLFKTIYTKHSLLYKVLIRHNYPTYIKTPAVSIQIKPRSEIAPFENQYYVISAAIFTFTFSHRERENDNKFLTSIFFAVALKNLNHFFTLTYISGACMIIYIIFLN